MNDADLDRLAALIADALLRERPGHRAGDTGRARDWLRPPIRPEPPARGGEPPVWSGAAQKLGDVAPGTSTGAAGGRVSTAELTNATRAAAAGRGATRAPATGPRRIGVRSGGARGTLAITVPIGVSNRHLHISAAHFRALFGADAPGSHREIAQPGQFAAKETVSVEGPRGTIDGVRIVGPARGETQLEISRGDAHALGVDAPLAASGRLESSGGGVTLRGPAGTVSLARGVIVAARHLHLSLADAQKFGLADGDRVDVRCGDGPRAATLHGALVRSGPAHATEFHLDLDEANAVGVKTGDVATIVARIPGGRAARRPLITETQLLTLAERGTPIPVNAILTPSARDRARALGLIGD